MARREFPKAVKVAVIRRATQDGVTFCEGCGALAKVWQIDHMRPDGLFGDPTIENAQLLGPCCYGPKNASDTTAVAKAKRREAKHIGASRPSGKFSTAQPGRRATTPPTKVAQGPSGLARQYGETK